MRNRVIILLVLPILFWAGCDTADVSDQWATPTIRVSLLNDHTQAGLEKASALLDVELIVRSSGGRDYSPEPVTVDNNVTQEVAFDVSIPPDSLYTFTVRFTGTAGLVAEGATIHQVTLETTVIDIAVLRTSTTVPSIAFIPSEVNASTGGGTIDVTVRLYGAGQAAAGVAALIDITGSTPRPFVLLGSGEDLKINFVEGGRLNAAWQFAQDVNGIRDIATLRLARNQTSNYCLEADEDNVRVVNRNGAITPATMLGACVTITP